MLNSKYGNDRPNNPSTERPSLELAKKAKSTGKNSAEYVEDLVSKQVKRPTFRELFADVRETITIDDDELEVAIRSAVNKTRQSDQP